MARVARTVRRGASTTQLPRPVGTALRQLVHDLGIERTLKEYDVITSWESIVGAQVAKVTKAQRIQNGTLIVSVASASWRAELTMRRLEIRDKINAYVGKEIVREIRFR